MKAITLIRRLVAVVLLYSLFIAGAHAQATRTWVSGVGDDANPCSRTAPCKTFAGAISKTAAGGAISVLDPGGFGAVTIVKSITIETDGQLAGVLSAGTNGVIVNAGAADVVILRGLQINGAGTGLNGIRYLAGSNLIVEDCTINGVTTNGIDFSPTATTSKLLLRNTTITRANGAGISVAPTGTGSAALTIENSRIYSNKNGITLTSGTLALNNSVVSQNDLNGVFANSSGANITVNVNDSTISNNAAVGVRALNATASVFVSNSTITGNGTGVLAAGGSAISTYKTNRLNSNSTNGTFTAILTGD
ncbi:right-handed parallel beta-helix repeat-containing protein [Tahibacter sp. UC22_41]|uniref:right-handed parallel beta-helix repeat-containing protein n=1 Tax=Tahibacter sp. UC22_41 TaxID=3350178 RepID=UPI0036DB8907